MFQEWIQDIKLAPERLKTVPTRARNKAHLAKENSRATLWTARANALEAAETWLASAPDNIPVFSRVADAAEKVAHNRLESFTQVSLSDYTDLNAKEAIKSIASLGHIELLRVKRLEAGTKARKTVLASIEKAIVKAIQPVESTVAA